MAAEDFPRRTILLATRDLGLRGRIRKILPSEFFILHADERETALHFARSSPIDFIILDSAFENDDSLKLCQELSDAIHREKPLLLVTGRLKQSFRAHALASGATDFINRQINPDELIQRLASGGKKALLHTKTAQASALIGASTKPKLYLLELCETPILKQLQIEEALLRTDDRSICVINYNAPRAIVMGLSSDPLEHLDLEKIAEHRIPVIKRFSGGGTVVIDKDTLLISFLMAKGEDLSLPFPEAILRWSFALYSQAWKLPGFELQANDYTLGDLKCGGNAQYIRKDRWLHHTSFLWDYDEKNMAYLLQPKAQPDYRRNRPHREFLCRLKDMGFPIPILIEKLKRELSERFDLAPLPLEELPEICARPHRKSTHLLEKFQ